MSGQVIAKAARLLGGGYKGKQNNKAVLSLDLRHSVATDGNRDLYVVHIYIYTYICYNTYTTLVLQIDLDHDLLSLALDLAQRREPGKPQRPIKVRECVAQDLLDARLAPDDAAVKPRAAHWSVPMSISPCKKEESR